jgi:pre-mRNA-splicing helicase BRR2
MGDRYQRIKPSKREEKKSKRHKTSSLDENVPAGDEQVDDQYGINVQFHQDTDDENEDDNIYGEVLDEEEGIDEDGEELRSDHAIHAETLAGTSAEELGNTKEKKLHPLDIDAYWVQRKLSKFYSDPMVSQARAGEVLQILKNIHDERECENQLVILLGFDFFDFIKLLKQNREMILYCSLLAAAQSESEREHLKTEMRSSPSLNKILRQLDTVRDESGAIGSENMETETSKRSSRRHSGSGLVIKDVTGGSGGVYEGHTGVPGLRELLDLDDMAFAQGSHFMANKNCHLPEGSFRKQRKGYEEVHVPALKQKPFEDDEILLSIEKLPQYAQPAFEGFRKLNRIQSRLYKTALESDENMLLCAPTVRTNLIFKFIFILSLTILFIFE